MRFAPRADHALGVEVQVSFPELNGPELIKLDSYLYRAFLHTEVWA
jgi:hypothetical protein